MTTFIPSPMGIMLIVMLIVGLGFAGGYLLWAKLKTRKINEEFEIDRLAGLDRFGSDFGIDKYRNYVHRLTQSIEDISKKSKAIKDEEIRAYWVDYSQELRVRQLKAIQTIQDIEYRELQHGNFKLLSDSDVSCRSAEIQRGIKWAADRSL